jgi:hypothetical protein
MGYTHYFEQETKPTDEQWAAITSHFRNLYISCLLTEPLPIQVEDDQPGSPVIDHDCIRFNGIGENGHETFVLRQEDEYFAFCKTAHKPYDLAVTAALLLTNHFAPYRYNIRSDGTKDAWKPAQQLIKDHLNLVVELPITLRD